MDRHRYLTSSGSQQFLCLYFSPIANDDYVFLASDERILEYDVSEVVADVKSEFQHIQIFRTVPFGNLLVLDGLQSEPKTADPL